MLLLRPQMKMINMKNQDHIQFNAKIGQSVEFYYGNNQLIPSELILPTVHPNPTTGRVTFKGLATGKQDEVDLVFQIYDLRGNIVKVIKHKVDNNKYYSIESMLDLSSGVYLYRLKTKDGLSDLQKLMIYK